MGVTKTDYVRGMQCPKMLWLDKHKKEERVIPDDTQEKLDEGNAFGDLAMGMFGDFEEMTTFHDDGRMYFQAMINKTKDAIERGVNNICEAAFSYCGNYCAVDILRKVSGGYEIYEVKNAPDVEEQFKRDIGFQRYILFKCGVKVRGCFIVTHGEDKSNPFVINDVSADAKSYAYEVDDNLWRLVKLKNQAEEYSQPMGNQCDKPYECWYKQYCERVTNK
jgi:hypothetical protein